MTQPLSLAFMRKFIFSKSFLIQLLLAFVLIAIVVWGAFAYLESYARIGEKVVVPDLHGLDVIESEAALKEAELSAEVVDSIFVLNQRGGIVVDQEPIPAAYVKKNRKIYLTITRYQTPTEVVPNVLNQTTTLAIMKLNRRGFEIGELIPKPDPCNGCPIGLEVAGKPLKVGSRISKGTTIDIIVGSSENATMVATPLLTSLKLDEAEELLHLQALNLGSTVFPDAETASDSAGALVFTQSPEEGELVPMGTSINLYLTHLPDKIPSVNTDSIKARLKTQQ